MYDSQSIHVSFSWYVCLRTGPVKTPRLILTSVASLDGVALAATEAPRDPTEGSIATGDELMREINKS